MNGSPGSRAGPPLPPLARPRALLALAIAGVVIALAGVAFLLGQRSRDAGAGGPSPGGRHAYLLQPSNGPATRVSLEVAADEAARERGLSQRRQVPAGTGMVFLFKTDTRAAFWMKDTLVPLQIAFVGADGRVVGLFEMPPCRADPCPTYAPAQPYRYAVELRSGAFTAAGIRQGDRVVARDPGSLPAPS